MRIPFRSACICDRDRLCHHAIRRIFSRTDRGRSGGAAALRLLETVSRLDGKTHSSEVGR